MHCSRHVLESGAILQVCRNWRECRIVKEGWRITMNNIIINTLNYELAFYIFMMERQQAELIGQIEQISSLIERI